MEYIIIFLILLGLVIGIFSFKKYPLYTELKTGTVYQYIGTSITLSGRKYHILRSTKTSSFLLVSLETLNNEFKK